MPIFEYRCKSCNEEFEKMIFRSDDTDITCPACHSQIVEKKMSAARVMTSATLNDSGCSSAPTSGIG